MEPVLFDTSVWVDFFQGRPKPYALLLKHYLAEDGPIFICPTIYQEILQGCKSAAHADEIASLLQALHFTEIPAYKVARQAADIYIKLRNKGITIRKPNDCLIAAYALEYKLCLLHSDSDFKLIASAYPLRCELS